nr:unnamed protein product [Spirometra erinaceieuropaei]
MIGLPVGTRHRLCHQHVLMVSPPDEAIVLQVPVSQPRVHTGGLLSHREAGVGVGQDEPVFCVGSWEEQAIVTGAVETMGTKHSSPGSVVCADVDFQATKDDQLIRLRHRHQEGVQVVVQLFPRLFRTGQQEA